MTNALTIDVEDYFQVSAFEAVSPPESWDTREIRVEANTRRVLRVLEETGVTATFFVLGWVAERFPDLVRDIAAAGHEVASHGHWHRRVCNQGREEFREDVRRSKAILENLTGTAVLGYRAPSYSISQLTLWAYDELRDAGYVYDSSVFPIRHDLYGVPDWPRFPFHLERIEGGNWVPTEPKARRRECWEAREPGGTESEDPPAEGPDSAKPLVFSEPALGRPTLIEVPITTLRAFGRNLPLAGGGYFRFFPYGITRWGLRRIHRLDREPFVFYLHPWELDPEQPRICGAGLKSRCRHYLNLGKTEGRFRRLLTDFDFDSIASGTLGRRARR